MSKGKEECGQREHKKRKRGTQEENEGGGNDEGEKGEPGCPNACCTSKKVKRNI